MVITYKKLNRTKTKLTDDEILELRMDDEILKLKIRDKQISKVVNRYMRIKTKSNIRKIGKFIINPFSKKNNYAKK